MPYNHIKTIFTFLLLCKNNVQLAATTVKTQAPKTPNLYVSVKKRLGDIIKTDRSTLILPKNSIEFSDAMNEMATPNGEQPGHYKGWIGGNDVHDNMLGKKGMYPIVNILEREQPYANYAYVVDCTDKITIPDLEAQAGQPAHIICIVPPERIIPIMRQFDIWKSSIRLQFVPSAQHTFEEHKRRYKKAYDEASLYPEAYANMQKMIHRSHIQNLIHKKFCPDITENINLFLFNQGTICPPTHAKIPTTPHIPEPYSPSLLEHHGDPYYDLHYY